MKASIQNYFDRSRQLTVKNKVYADLCLVLWDFFVESDRAHHDATSAVLLANSSTTVYVVSNESGIIAGIEEIEYLLRKRTKLQVKALIKDGAKIKKRTKILKITGSVKEILQLERTILNILQRMSGIASLTDKMVKMAGKTAIAATRKTYWGLLDKKAVAVGGGLTHRLDLSDGVLIKDNHIDITTRKNSLSRIEAIKKIVTQVRESLFELEVANEREALVTKVPIIMLDNFSVSQAKKTIQKIKKRNPSTIIELSGGITEENLKEYANVGAHVISLGALTHSAPALNLTLSMV